MYIKKIGVFFAVMLGVVGCLQAPEANKPIKNIQSLSITSTPHEIYKFTIATGAARSDWYDEGKGLSAEINAQSSNLLSNIKETESLMENVDLLTSGKAGLVFVYDFHVVFANRGKLMDVFPDAPMEKIAIKCGTEMARPMFPDYAEAARIILPLYEEHVLIVVPAESDVKSWNDLKGKRISIGAVGSAIEQQARFIFTALDMHGKDEISRENFDLFPAIHALQNGEIDALLWSVHLPSKEVSDLLNSPDIKLKIIPINKDEEEMILQSVPGVFHKSRIPAGAFGSIPGDIDTLATTVVLAAMDDFPVDHAVQILTV